jgi:hypothetical protein
MKDSEVRGIVLKKFYDLRDEQSHLEFRDLENTGLPRNTLEGSRTIGRTKPNQLESAKKHSGQRNPIHGRDGKYSHATFLRFVAGVLIATTLPLSRMISIRSAQCCNNLARAPINDSAPVRL